MRIHINLGKIFSWVFGNRKRRAAAAEEARAIEASFNWSSDLTADAVLNCCEQMGAFDSFNIEDENTINAVCQEVANVYNAGERSKLGLRMAFVEGFRRHSFNVGEQEINMFVDCYIESYLI
jgi:hypothetical protein